MRKSRFGDQQIALALHQVEPDVPVAKHCGKPGIGERMGQPIVTQNGATHCYPVRTIIFASTDQEMLSTSHYLKADIR
jgi:hypothetical protein